MCRAALELYENPSLNFIDGKINPMRKARRFEPYRPRDT